MPMNTMYALNLSKIEPILLLKFLWHFFGHFILKQTGAKTDFRKESKKLFTLRGFF